MARRLSVTGIDGLPARAIPVAQAMKRGKGHVHVSLLASPGGPRWPFAVASAGGVLTNTDNFKPFAPFGFNGIFKGASVVFFAYLVSLAYDFFIFLLI